ncbi:MAG: PEP-CTERM sorting domain-containing protein [Proteobacteria bacterium]|nr:PEP-CTERM sorting domain-containing protein [Pseudomonadota bacterium]
MSRRLISTAILGLSLAACMAPGAWATATTNINGVVVPVGLVPGGNQIQSGFLNETTVAGVGDTLSGTGYVNAIALGTNSSDQTWSNGQNGVMLAFVFSGYTVSSVVAPTANTTGSVDFTGGTVNFYTLAAGTNLQTGTEAGDIAAITSGTLWLSTSAAVEGPNGTTLSATLPAGDSASNIVNAASGLGYLDATGGPAGSIYHTGTFTNPYDVGGVSDMSFTSDFSNAPSGSDFPISGSATLKANTVPEPGAAAILASGVVLLGFVGMRRRRQGAGAMTIG